MAKEPQKTIVFKVSDNIKDQMIEHYQDFVTGKPPYSIFQVKQYDCVITLYESGKVMFQGIGADIEANMWKDLESHFNKRDIDNELKEKEEKLNNRMYYYNDAIGSDEVGTGDYFGPIIVTATYVDKSTRKLLEDMKIMDSKKMTDEKIKRCAPIIMKKVPYVTFTLSNSKYNELHKKGFNMNKVKAILHNKVLYELSHKGHQYQRIIVDQFTTPISYFKYLKEENINEKVTKITFLTKGENAHLSVAAASVISRFRFLEEMDNLSKKYNVTIPKGANEKVDEAGKQIVAKFGKEELNKIAKIDFKNTQKILSK